SVVRLECSVARPRAVTDQFRQMVLLVQSFRERESPCCDAAVGQASRKGKRDRVPGLKWRGAITADHRTFPSTSELQMLWIATLEARQGGTSSEDRSTGKLRQNCGIKAAPSGR